MQMKARAPLSASTLRPSSAHRAQPHSRHSTATVGSPRRSGPVSVLAAYPVATDTSVCPAPPEERLASTLQECLRLDRELKVIENSGHSKIGVFAKPFGDQQRCRLMATAAKQDAEQHLPEDPTSETAFIEDDDVTSDPFFHQFFGETGQSMYEQLLRARMRAVALTKMVYSRQSVQFVRAEVELAETYARVNLWKQAHSHVVVGYEILKTLDAARVSKKLMSSSSQTNQADSNAERAGNQDVDDAMDENASGLFAHVLDFFYRSQLSTKSPGVVTVDELVHATSAFLQAKQSSMAESSPTTAVLAAIFQLENLVQLVGSVPSFQWQQLLVQMERQSAIFQDFLRDTESKFPERLLLSLRNGFNLLDPSHFGVVPLRSLIECLHHSDGSSSSSTLKHSDKETTAVVLSCICDMLKHHDERVQYPSIAWSELVQLSSACLFDGADDPARDLRPRIRFFFGRFFLRKGQLEDAMRYLTIAIAEEEQLHGADSSSLVPFYLCIAETLGVRFKQLSVVAQQNAFDISDKWLKSTEGSRRVRSKALDLIDVAARHQGKVMAKKDADAQARDELMKEYAALSFVRPDATSMEDAIEYCTKAWRLQEQACGAGHITTASVHVALAQLYAIKKDWSESVRCYLKAIAIYEDSCCGPVPASSWLKLELAKLYHLQTHEYQAAASAYEEVGDFFHSFAMEFASSNSTRRDSCDQAITAWRQWLVLAASPSSLLKCTLEQHKQTLVKIHDATRDGYGEFAVETAARASEVAHFLIKMGQLRPAERHLRTSWYIVESHFGPNDRRARKARKELVELSNELKGAAALDGEDDGGHEWLTL